MKPKGLRASDAIFAEAMAHGIALVLIRTVLEHVRAAGGTEKAMRAERRIMDVALDELRPRAMADKLSDEAASETIRKRVKVMVDETERYVRKELGLPPPLIDRH